jgi:hypothetical protein
MQPLRQPGDIHTKQHYCQWDRASILVQFLFSRQTAAHTGVKSPELQNSLASEKGEKRKLVITHSMRRPVGVKWVLSSVRSLMVADSFEGLGCLTDDNRVSAGCGFA